MTRTTNARLAGFAYLFYIAVAFPANVLFDRATAGAGVAAKLASIAEHVSDMRISMVLSLLSSFSALTLAVTLYAITRDEDGDLAMLGLICRVGEGVLGAIHLLAMAGLVWLATTTGPNVPDAVAARPLAAFMLRVGIWNTAIGATFFAVGSTFFSYLLLRGRMIPVPLAWLGVLGSILLVVGLPAQLIGILKSPAAELIWIPMAAFEVPLGFWLLIKGVAPVHDAASLSSLDAAVVAP
jgi:hypothetical protein